MRRFNWGLNAEKDLVMTKHSYVIAQITDRRMGVIVRLPPEVLNVLTQVRGAKFEISEDILPSILARGQMNPGRAVALSYDEAVRYLERWNQMFGSAHTISELISITLDGEELYVILIYGHRRLLTVLAVIELIKQGKASYTENFDGSYTVELRRALTAEEAIEMQFHENRHSVPAPHLEAKRAWGYYRYLQIENPNMSPTEFAAHIGRTPDWIRNAMRFCSLPPSIQGFVNGDNEYKETLPYGVLIHLARLAEGLSELGIDFPEEGQKSWLLDAVVDSLDTAAFGKKVSEFLNDKREEIEGQRALFDLSQTDEQMLKRRRQIIDTRLTMAQWANYSWLDRVQNLVQSGALGGDNPLDLLSKDGTFSPGSPVRIMAANLHRTALLLPVLAQIARSNRLGHVHEFEEAAPYVQRMAEMLTTLMVAEQPPAVDDTGDDQLDLPVAAE